MNVDAVYYQMFFSKKQLLILYGVIVRPLKLYWRILRIALFAEMLMYFKNFIFLAILRVKVL
jgi:hypothetical protein